MLALLEYSRCVRGLERDQALLLGRIKMGFMEVGGHLPWLLKNFEDLTEMIEETFLMERGNKGREGKGNHEAC